MTVSQVRFQSDLMSAEDAQLLLPKLTDEQLATLKSYGTTEKTSVGQVLAAAGDLTYDLMVMLEGEVEVADIHDGRRRALFVLGPRDFIAELDLLTGQRLYATFVVIEAGSLIRVPRSAVKAIIETDATLGELLVQTLFRRREALLLLRSGMQLIGSRYSLDTQRLREFAARNRFLFSWIDLDNDQVAPALLHTLGLEPRDTPVIVLGGSAVLVNPSNAELATAAGITDEPLSGSLFDLLVIGGGPAGLAAAVYGATEGLSTAVVEALAPGGQVSTTSRIENYLGFPTGVSGTEFGERAQLQAQRLGSEMFVPHAGVSLSHHDGYYHVMLENDAELLGKAVIIATGVSYRGLDVSGIEKFEGVGVFYSPADADHVEAGEPVVIVGGGNSAGQAATALAASGHEVHLLVRGHALAETMSTYLLDRIAHAPRITVHTQTVVAAVHGDRQLESVVIEDRLSGEDTEVPTHYLFVMIGAEPHTAWLEGTVLRDRRGFIPTGDEISAAVLSDNDWATQGRAPYLLETSLPGVFAVGDVRANSVKRVAAAVGEGSMAVLFAQRYLGQLGS
ncbi:MAG: thioredoxin reductase [Actinomycetota bacterium]|jgi:thioredoxin reductase (NADPH)|nr:thioredoxin reductase [Actinomycetota bacterium]